MDKTQAKSHEKEVNNVLEIITNMINPFEVEGNSLFNIASGVVAPTDVCKDMLSAKDIGESKCKGFVTEQLLVEDPDLFARLPSTQLKTFSMMLKKSKVKTSKGQIVELKNDMEFVSRLLAIGSSRNLNMKKILTYSLRKYPSPFATVDGQLVKTPKSKLMHAIEERAEDAIIDQFPLHNALMIDAMAVIQMLKGVPDTFGSLAEYILQNIITSALKSNSKRVDFVSDRYPEVSIKNLERSKRAEVGSTVIQILGAKQKVPRQFKKFLSVGRNKESLIEFLFQHFRLMEQLSETLRGITVYMNHGEFCHQIYTNVNGEVQIEECPELISNQE